MGRERSSIDGVPSFALPWILRLRWTAAVGQSVTVLVVVGWMRIQLPLLPVWSLIGVTAVSNILLSFISESKLRNPRLLVAVLAGDVVLLTWLLHYTGGSHNPFSSFYLVHAALAAVVLPFRWTTLIAGLCCGGYAWLFFVNMLAPSWSDVVCGIGPELPWARHLQGMLVAFLLTTLCVAFFANRLQQALRMREAELAQARTQMQRQEYFVSLATLAAGAAHELGTPIGTIGIAAGEVARWAAAHPSDADLVEDAELIQEEVARCRAILDRLQHQSEDSPQTIRVTELMSKITHRMTDAQIEFTGEIRDLEWTGPVESLVQALSTLVKNAKEAQRADLPVRFNVSGDSEALEFIVTDAGVGMTDEVRRRAGDPFFTTKEPGKGMGLGLFLVKIFVQRLEGSIRLVPASSGGTHAILRIPCHR